MVSFQLILKPTPLGSGPGGQFTLEDGVQPQLELVSAERDLIAATFTQLLIANCGGEDTFKVPVLSLILVSIYFAFLNAFFYIVTSGIDIVSNVIGS